ncbi:STAS-like domain-containing protein [Rheinheimera sp. NSM]|uniref:STAS-like domain-containing protein n=1 Tax=Rheinheimera sp. NSM TaxID=3457884 RepID=UPI004036F22E
MDYNGKLHSLRKKLDKDKTVTLELPAKFTFKDHGIFDFEPALRFFNWDLENVPVRVDFRQCSTANYQALSLLVAYLWKLRNQGCRVSIIESESKNGASEMWRAMGARGLFDVAIHENQNFKSNNRKPLLAIRNSNDFKLAISRVEKYTAGFNVEYLNTLRYVLSELLYNTLEHGKTFFNFRGSDKRVPSLIQFTWYQKGNEIHFIVADTGIGIRKHIEQAYPGQESDEEAIKLAIKPQVSGTFGSTDPYKEKNNAGVGLFLSTNIIRRLNADMHIVSGNGVLHISPRDITGKTLKESWNGTFVLVSVKLEQDVSFALHQMMQEFRIEAKKEQDKGDREEKLNTYYLSIKNFFGSYAEDKEAAIKFRDSRLFPEIREGKSVIIDFDGVASAPHSFLSGLFASPIKTLGMKAYKVLKFVNTLPEIRETLDFILDENTDS